MMRVYFLIISLVFIISAHALAGSAEEDCNGKISFSTAEVYVDSNKEALAAYQIDIKYDKEKIKIVGLEGGTDGFNKPPFYDQAGFEGGHIILAAFVSDDTQAKRGNSKVARLHLQTTGCPPFVLKTEPMAAAKPGGKSIPVKVKIDFISRQN
ncbi:MAG: hypothetical protein JW927_16255 [Deltaproteobacteria bacterium]|nr:hypothetical protein [Deltaproteobacteria bacterium]